MGSRRRLVFDGDVIVHEISSVTEVPIHWGDDIWTVTGDMRQAMEMFAAEAEDTAELFGCNPHESVFAFSDYSKTNWRRAVYPGYKAARPGVHRKPLLFWPMRSEISKAVGKGRAFCWPSLEADDVMGILSSAAPEDWIMVSVDKDMLQIPGSLYNPRHPENGLREIPEKQADLWHMIQTLTGDMTDGYPGCPGIGPVRAKRALNGEPSWDVVANTYEAAGLTEDDALQQARVARILRYPEYDHETSKVTLWTPPRSSQSTRA